MINRAAYMKRIEPFIGKNVIKVLVGVRRAGKSTLLELVRHELARRGVSEADTLVVNFESSRFAAIVDAETLVSYVSENIDPDRKQYLFFDEIQEVDGWEKALRSFMVDYDVDMYVTGSNARLLSSDLATHITGRYVRILVFPFSFAECVEAYGELDEPVNERVAFNRFVDQGGFPFQVDLGFEREPTLQYLQDVFSTILLKDVVQKNEFRDTEQLERIVYYVLQEIGHSFSAKSISDYLKSERRSVSVDTVYNYLRAAEEACLIYRVPREDAIGKRALKFNEKFYVVDQGLRQAVGNRNAEAIDQVLENIVYMELLRRGYEVTVGKVGDAEIDFIARRKGEIEYYQVTYLLADERVVDREFGVLEALSDNYPKYVLSLDDFPTSRNGVRGLNVVSWLLSERA